MTVTTVVSDPSGPLSHSQQSEVATAQDRARKIRQAATVSKWNGWMTGIAAVCSAPFAMFSLSGFLVLVGLSVISYNEFRGRQRLLKFEGAAAAFLGWNQLGFLAMILIYCTWMLVAGLTGEGIFAAELKAKPELGVAFDSVEEIDQLYKIAVVAFYGTTIVLSVLFQGLNALYYFTRQKLVYAYVQNTPDWVLDLQRLTSPT